MAVKSVRGLLNRYKAAPAGVREYFRHLPGLVRDYPLSVCLSYVFAQVELAHNMTLYCGVVKLHQADATLTRAALHKQRMSRREFRDKFKTVFGKPPPKRIWGRLTEAERVRDNVMHGKTSSDHDKRNAIAAVLEYADDFNQFVYRLAEFRPFGDLRGFKGRGASLEPKTTRWILKGMGLTLS